ncbi:hypothetical protein [Simiduia agarivorans]|uniref:Signal peptide-containing protein n=1 Tax=Simiduia agarivorans (strain DSM 21679 / JCM 13881 / BCRC 17597 / SA1) TaxID=1117647 RepID=K4KLQ6_SIMAS|nr:hypothetical protein [Simiduia agarivorans]AFV00110.1 signal peptide-containing protein [Simiduia agarivorans SA1 = DSM 21679]
MRIIHKVGVYLVMLVVAVFVAAIYGVIQGQFSYTLSTEYFSQYRFKQLNILWAYDYPRLGVALVGAVTSWWVGAVLSIVVGLFGFMFSSPSLMAKYLTRTLCLVIGVVFSASVLGLGYGYYSIDHEAVVQIMPWMYPGVSDPIQFMRVGFMYNGSFIGGFLGLIFGVLYIIYSKFRYNNPLQPIAKSAVAD